MMGNSMTTQTTLLPMLILGGVPSWQMPQLTGLNKLPPRATLIPYPIRCRRTPPRAGVLSLVHEPERDLGVQDQSPGRKMPPGRQSTEVAWSPIAVPGNWTMQGFGRPHYTNVVMPFPNLPPDVPDENPTGIYRRQFTLPDGWRGRRSSCISVAAKARCTST